MTTVTFGRTNAWVSGWKGKESRTPIRRDGEEVGHIHGFENAAIPGDMTYSVYLGTGRERLIEQTGTLADAKRIATAALEEPEDGAVEPHIDDEGYEVTR